MAQSQREKAIHATRKQLETKKKQFAKLAVVQRKLDEKVSDKSFEIQVLKDKLRRQGE